LLKDSLTQISCFCLRLTNDTPTNSNTGHLIDTARAKPIAITKRRSPQPLKNQALIRVHSIALNPVDYIQQSMGSHVPCYPHILGLLGLDSLL
jgi:hypothetical protein